MLLYFCQKHIHLSTIIFKAIGAGILLSVLIGPVFFILLETSIRKGIRAALAFDAGVFLSDLIYIAIAYIFFNKVQELTENKDALRAVGACFFILFGIHTYLKKPKPHGGNDGINVQSDYLRLFTKGFFLNLLNPTVIFYWFGILTFGSKDGNTDISDGLASFIYISILMITFFSFDVLKIIGAKMLRPYITDQVLIYLNKLTGIILFGVGVIFALQVILK
jgi:threonine/homoserine/homoserine lactone efflux protein